MNSPDSKTLNTFTCVSIGISPISSRKIVPLLAVSKYPFLVSLASVYAPFLCPNSSLSIIPSGIAPQLTITSSLEDLLLPKCNALLTNSLPVPDSPFIKIDISTLDTWEIISRT